MKVYLTKDIEKIGMAGEIVKVKEGFGRNFLIPRNMGVEITCENESFYQKRVRVVEKRKEVIESKTSLLAEKIKHLHVKLKRKMHDDGKLYGAVSPLEVVELLAKESISVSKSQIKFGKSIKEKGVHTLTVKLTSRLQPQLKITVLPE